MDENQLTECFNVAEETLSTMDHFYEHLPLSFHFPPHPQPMIPKAERVDPNDVWTPPFSLEFYCPQTEKDRIGNVSVSTFRFEYTELVKQPKLHLQKPWSFEIKALQAKEELRPDHDWISFQKRSKLIQNRIEKKNVQLQPKLTPEERDKNILKKFHEKHHLHYKNAEYPLQAENPLYKY